MNMAYTMGEGGSGLGGAGAAKVEDRFGRGGRRKGGRGGATRGILNT